MTRYMENKGLELCVSDFLENFLLTVVKMRDKLHITSLCYHISELKYSELLYK